MKKYKITMNMRKLMIALSLAFVSFGVVGCGDFLDTMPDNRTQIDNLDKVKALLVSAYPYRFYASTLEPRCDGYTDLGATYQGSQPGTSLSFQYTNYRWEEYTSIEGADDNEAYWTACYKAIAAANHALAALDEMDNPKGSEAYRAEALLCRAYAHFCLLTIHADFFDEANRATKPGIPYVTEPEDEVYKQYDRGTVASTLEKVKADLAEGMAHIGTGADHDQPKFHFSGASARAFAVRVALFERDYPTVISLVSQQIPQPSVLVGLQNAAGPLVNADGTPVKIPHPYQDVAFLYCGANFYNWDNYRNISGGSQGIGLSFTDPKSPHVLLSCEPYSLLHRITYSNAFTRYNYSQKSIGVVMGDNATGYGWNLPAYGFSSANSPSYVPKMYEDFKSDDDLTGQPHVRLSLFRQEELILARAEAYAMTGEYDKAIHDLTMYVQNRVGAQITACYLSRDKVVNYYDESLSMPGNYLLNNFNAGRFTTDLNTYEGKLQRALILMVLDTRRTEFLYEGMRWFDILRWNIPVEHRMITGETSTLTPDDDRRVVQLPRNAELSGLEKNPYEHIPQPWN